MLEVVNARQVREHESDWGLDKARVRCKLRRIFYHREKAIRALMSVGLL